MAIAALLDSAVANDLGRRATRLLRTRLGDELVVVPVAADTDVTGATQRVLESLHPRAVVAVGGDAMITAVAAALVDMPVALGIVPLDPAARLARQLGVPTDLHGACAAVADGVASGHHARIDVLAIDGRIILSRTVMGRLADLDAPEPDHTFLERVRWAQRSLARLFGPTARYHIDVDGHPLGVRASSVVVANSGSVGIGGLKWAPEIAIDDGVADVVVIRSSTLLDYLLLVVSWSLGRERRRQAMHVRAKSRIEIRCSRTVSITHDGTRGRTNEISVRLVRSGLQVLMPPRHAIAEPPSDIPSPIPPLQLATTRAS